MYVFKVLSVPLEHLEPVLIDRGCIDLFVSRWRLVPRELQVEENQQSDGCKPCKSHLEDDEESLYSTENSIRIGLLMAYMKSCLALHQIDIGFLDFGDLCVRWSLIEVLDEALHHRIFSLCFSCHL